MITHTRTLQHELVAKEKPSCGTAWLQEAMFPVATATSWNSDVSFGGPKNSMNVIENSKPHLVCNSMPLQVKTCLIVNPAIIWFLFAMTRSNS